MAAAPAVVGAVGAEVGIEAQDGTAGHPDVTFVHLPGPWHNLPWGNPERWAGFPSFWQAA